MKPSAKLISKLLISSSNHTKPTRSWHPLLEQKLHQINCRNSLNPLLVAQVIDPFLLDHHSLALGFFNWASQQPGYTHTSNTYQSLLKSLSISRQFNSVEKVLKQVKTQRIVLDLEVYRSIIASHIICKKPYNAFLVFNGLGVGIRELGIGLCNSLLAALASDEFIQYGLKVFDEMRVRGVGLSTVGFGVFIGRYCRNVELERILRMIEEVVTEGVSGINGSVVALLIVDGLCRVSRVAEADWVLDELRIRSCKPDFMAYRIVAEALRLLGRVEEAEKVLKRKRKLGVAPRIGDYREFLFCLISERRIQEAKELGEVIIDGNFPIDNDVLNVLIGSISAIDPDSAISFCKFMIEKNTFPTLLTLNNLSRNLCKNGKVDEMLEVFGFLSSKDYFSDLESYNVMVSFLCKAGRVKETYGVLQEMRKKGFDPDVSSYNSLMEACCREDLVRPAKRLWDEMFSSGCRGNLKTYNILIRKFSETGEVEEACRLFYHMLEKEVTPDPTTYTFLLEGLCREAKIETACVIFNKSIEKDVALAKTIFTTFVSSLCKEGNYVSASKVIRSFAPNLENQYCHVVLLKTLADAGEVRMAMEHIQWVGEHSSSTLQAISTELIASLSCSLKPEPILQLLHWIQEKVLLSDSGTWTDLCKNGSFTR
ncbi:hypothetical protein GIB67_041795 [Kingdonia uniflora]|uniref:Pentatricopeptide repeat-containing protein n=1 Tax=Kingdonia uniflora TaxID=39325 RepID=A0A7J7L5S2_9MAGN|nr:hypothetical protein GIB67_041795 [Kingdonia uniflora]